MSAASLSFLHRAVVLVVSCLWSLGPASAVVPAQQGSPAPVAAEDPLIAARQALADVSLEEGELAIHASDLLDGEDTAALSAFLLEGREPVVRAILTALKTNGRVGFIDEVLSVAASTPSEGLATRTVEALRRMACADPSVRTRLAGELQNELLPAPGKLAVIAVLGGCRDLSQVDALIALLDGPYAAAAQVALTALTAFEPPPRADREVWTRFWVRNQGRSRDELLEAALALERDQHRVELTEVEDSLRAMRSEVEQARIDLMGQDVERLKAALLDAYPRVREAAAQRLAAHASPELAGSALPLLLSRLGSGSEPSEGGGSSALELSAPVRAVVIEAVGVLGRNRPEVVPLLVAELSSAHPEVSAAAVGALSRVKGRPEIVLPLLALLDRGDSPPELAVMVFAIIAANRPSSVLGRLERHLASASSAAVREQVVWALAACEELEDALDLLEDLAAPGEHEHVRFALASALGARGRELASQPEVRARMVVLLGRLAADAAPSVRAEAVSSLGKTGDPAALPYLRERAAVETDPAMAGRVVRALGELGDLAGVETIGRLCAGRPAGDAVLEEGRAAVSSLGQALPAAAWWQVAQELSHAGAVDLALMAAKEIAEPSRPGAVVDRQLAAEAQGMRAELLATSFRWREAHDLLVGLHNNEASHPGADRRLQLLSRAAEELGLWEEASTWMGQWRTLMAESDPRRDGVSRRMLTAWMAASRFEQARIQAQELISRFPGDNDLLFQLGEVHRRLGEDGEARDVFDRLLSRVPPDDPLLERVRLAMRDLAAPVDPPVPESGHDESSIESDEAP